MTTQTHFFGTRTLARNFLNESTAESAKLKDFGKDAATGERWAVLVEVPEVQETVQHSEIEMHQSMDTAIDSTIDFLKRERLMMDASTITNQRPGIIGEQTLKTPNNKPCRVSWRRSMTAVRLAKHLQKVS